MKVPQFLLSAAVTVAILIQSWTLKTVVELKVEVATLSAQMRAHLDTGKNIAYGKPQP